LFCLFGACWQALIKPCDFTVSEPHSTLSAINQGVPPFCEEIQSIAQNINLIQNISSNAALARNTAINDVKWLLSCFLFQDFNRFKFVSLFLFPFHYLF
jgi:hypothetical protein